MTALCLIGLLMFSPPVFAGEKEPEEGSRLTELDLYLDQRFGLIPARRKTPPAKYKKPLETLEEMEEGRAGARARKSIKDDLLKEI